MDCVQRVPKYQKNGTPLLDCRYRIDPLAMGASTGYFTMHTIGRFTGVTRCTVVRFGFLDQSQIHGRPGEMRDEGMPKERGGRTIGEPRGYLSYAKSPRPIDSPRTLTLVSWHRGSICGTIKSPQHLSDRLPGSSIREHVPTRRTV